MESPLPDRGVHFDQRSYFSSADGCNNLTSLLRMLVVDVIAMEHSVSCTELYQVPLAMCISPRDIRVRGRDSFLSSPPEHHDSCVGRDLSSLVPMLGSFCTGRFLHGASLHGTFGSRAPKSFSGPRIRRSL